MHPFKSIFYASLLILFLQPVTADAYKLYYNCTCGGRLNFKKVCATSQDKAVSKCDKSCPRNARAGAYIGSGRCK